MIDTLITYPSWHQTRLNTTDDGTYTIATIPVPVGATTGHGYTVALRVVISARCTDAYVDLGLAAFGEGGWVDNAGTATPLGSQFRIYTNAYTWHVQFSQSGGNILVQVNGDAFTDVAWLCRYAVDQVLTV